jgi:hypothetical protein
LQKMEIFSIKNLNPEVNPLTKLEMMLLTTLMFFD